MGEYLTHEEYKKLAWDNVLAGVIWILAGAFSAFMYVRGVKKAEAREAAALANEEPSSSSSSIIEQNIQ